MPYAVADDACRLHYQVMGRRDGTPVVMIQGLGADLNGWILQRLALAGRHRVLCLDNRGAGRSTKPTEPYSLVQMSDDVAAVMDHAGVERAHVVGASMGGVIAQLLAVRHPERVQSLSLVCTACRHEPWRRELLAEWAEVAAQRGMREMSHLAMRWLIGPRSLRRFWPALGLFGPLAMSLPAYAFVNQVEAILNTPDDLAAELSQISAPTSVIVGSQDVLTPLADSEELAERIPGSTLHVVSGAAHGLMVEHARPFNRVLGRFLSDIDAGVTCAAS